MNNEDEPVMVGLAMAKFHGLVERFGVNVDLDDEPEQEELDLDGMRAQWLDRVWATKVADVHQAASMEAVAVDPGPAIYGPLCDWADRYAPKGQNLVLMGPVGTGKSFAAIAAAQLWLRERFQDLRTKREPLMVMQVVELLDMLRPNSGAATDLAQRCMDTPLLMLDDLGAERATEWAAERLFSIVNRRWLDQRCTIVTTNVPAGDLPDAVGDRVLSRLAGGAVVLRLAGHDRRRA